MPPREWYFRIEDMLESIEKVQSYIEGMDYDAFKQSSITIDAVIRNLEVIGEAATHIPKEISDQAPEIPWSSIKGMRNILIHEYFGADTKTIWSTATVNLPSIVKPLKNLLIEKR